MSQETTALVFGLGSAISWGAGDFSGGFATRKGNVFLVIFVSQIIGTLMLTGSGFLFSRGIPDTASLAWGSAAGLAGTLGLVALYSGLAQGTMGIVAPLSAILTALIPMGFSFAMEGMPGPGHLTGFAFAMAAVFFLSYSRGDKPLRNKELRLSLLAGAGFGLFFIAIDQAVTQSVIWPLVAARVSSLFILTVLLTVTGKFTSPRRGQLPFIILAGILDAGGNVLFALATHAGRLDISAVLSSLYPASTVFLAWIFLKERLEKHQWIGVASAVAALVLISA